MTADLDSPDGGTYAVVAVRPDGGDATRRLRGELRAAVHAYTRAVGAPAYVATEVASMVVADHVGASTAVQTVALTDATLIGYLRLTPWGRS